MRNTTDSVVGILSLQAGEQVNNPVPVVAVESVFHVGSMNAALRGMRGDSQEVGCLSVSLCPRAWTSIARLGGRGTWRLSKGGGVFLDMHRASQDRSFMAVVMAWAAEHDFCHREARFRAYRWDDESASWGYMLCATRAAALAEIDDELLCADTDGPDGGPLVQEVSVNCASWSLAGLVGASERQLDDCDDLVLIAWAMKVVPELDGVWWTETYAPEILSAPRGGIFPRSMNRWEAAEVAPADIPDDLDLMKAADCEAMMPLNVGGV
jgi:hypothetical protein